VVSRRQALKEKRRKKVEEIAARQQKIARAFTRFAGHWEF
jgi:hypothetical protein